MSDLSTLSTNSKMEEEIVIPVALEDGTRGWLTLPPRPLTASEGERLVAMVRALTEVPNV